MSDQASGTGGKKDLTSLVELSEQMGQAQPDQAASAIPPIKLSDAPQETEFESIEEFSKHEPELNPAADLPTTSAPDDINIHTNQDAGEPAIAIDPLEALPDASGLPPLGQAPIGTEELASDVNAASLGLAEDALAPVSDFDAPDLSNPAEPEPVVVITAPPAAMSHTVPQGEAPTHTQDLEPVKHFGEKLAIGQPRIEAVPAFSVLITGKNHKFDERVGRVVAEVLAEEDFGIRFEDVEVQLSQGRLLIPQISEYAAIILAQKLHDVVDEIQIDLADQIYRSSEAVTSPPTESMFLDNTDLEQHREEIHDLGAEPQSEAEVFSTNLSEIDVVASHQITRILSALTASLILDAAVAEDPTKREFEAATEKLTRELVSKAFQLRANGVIGLTFTLRPIQSYRDAAGKTSRAYRLIGTGTAVRARKKTI